MLFLIQKGKISDRDLFDKTARVSVKKQCFRNVLPVSMFHSAMRPKRVCRFSMPPSFRYHQLESQHNVTL